MKNLLPASTLLSVNKTSKNPQGFSAKREAKGFTLIELLIAVTIIAVLAVIGVTVFSGAQKNARDSRRRADIEAISKALEARINNTVDQNCQPAAASSYCAPEDSWFAGGVVPTDPSTGAQYSTLPANGATTYSVCATLETPAGTTFCRTNQQ